MRLPTRRKKERPTTLPVMNIQHPTVVAAAEAALRAGRREFSAKIEPLQVQPHEYPTSLLMCLFNSPGVLLGKPRSDDVYPMEMSFWKCGNHAEMANLQKKYGATAPYPDEVNPLLFARFLAKIAHSFAAAIYGVDSFEPLVVDLILGRTKNFLDIVGGEMKQQPTDPENKLNFLDIAQRQINGAWYLVVRIRLFPGLGTPLYQIVVGAQTGPMSALLTKS